MVMGDDATMRIDLLGFLCPIPVHETRRVLKGCAHGDKIEVICDDPETCLLYTSPSPRD